MNDSHLDVRISKETALHVRKLAATKGLSVSAFLRMIILEYLEQMR